MHIANYQDRYYGGAAMIRLYTFDLDRDTIDVETFAPWFLARDPAARNPLEAESQLTGPDDRFSMAIGFDTRFAGFAPAVLPLAPPGERGDRPGYGRLLAIRHPGSGSDGRLTVRTSPATATT